jgi:hypothetical protein
MLVGANLSHYTGKAVALVLVYPYLHHAQWPFAHLSDRMFATSVWSNDELALGFVLSSLYIPGR